MTKLNLTLYLAASFLELTLFVLIIARKFFGRFAVFLGYLGCLFIGDTMLPWVGGNSRQFYLLWWVVQAIYVLLSFAVILALFRSALRQIHSRFGPAGFVLPLVLLILVNYLFWQPVHHGFGSAFLGRFGSAVSSFKLAFSSLAVVVFSFALWLEKRYGIWGQYGLGIVGGFSLHAVGTLLAYFVRLWFGGKFEAVFSYIPSVAFLLAGVVWLITFMAKEDPEAPREPLDPAILHEIMDAFQESVEEVRRKVRRYGIRFRHRVA